MGTTLKNGTGNLALGKNSVAIGVGCVAVGQNQIVLGTYPEIPTGDSTSHAVIIGGGDGKDSRFNSLVIDKNGEYLEGGGGQVYMKSPDTGDIIPVFMTGTNNRIKKVLMSK